MVFFFKPKNMVSCLQAKNDIPVHLKGGKGDKILFGITLALTGVGLLGCVEFFYSILWKK